MTNVTINTVARPEKEAQRAITHRTHGNKHGPITRLMSPGDLGEVVKPFVFLDLFQKDGPAVMLGLHPHSGIATTTYVIEGTVAYTDPDGSSGVVRPGGMEWMMAGKGMWHVGGALEGRVSGFQMWLALPPELELAPHQARYIEAEEVETLGPARLLVGGLGETKALVAQELPIAYLGVKLTAGETWRFTPPVEHSVLWIAVAAGRLSGPEGIEAGEMVVFEPSEKAVSFRAETDATFVLGSAKPHEYDLALGYYSVHTSPEALEAGEREIALIGEKLKREGCR